ncbi:MAG TPA: amino acid ABC transporter substrate-binding protein [Acetobacteraceae bacterium]|jgi:general L-amino acid transport system substrate-binding protein|nr:amino acid ABC transporter substrate-binding protein [Acetobacteraceae bacterium]
MRLSALSASLALLLSGAAAAQPAPQADTLSAVRNRGTLACGVSTGVAGLSQADSQGNWRGIDADFCRAVAAAVFGDPGRLRFVPTTPQNRFTALQSGEVDLLARNTTYSFSRDVGSGLSFTGITLYDGQGFMLRRELGITQARQLDGATVCLQPGTTSELNLADWARANSIRFSPVVIENFGEVQRAFFAGRCDVYTTDRSGLASTRAGLGNRANDYVILPDAISREPLGPLVRKGDWRWFDIVKWTGHALVAAEELGVTSQNAEARRAERNPEVQRLLGATGDFGQALGLDNRWAMNAIRAVGNYAEIWERNLTPIGLERGPNRLWRDGGLLYAPPFR